MKTLYIIIFLAFILIGGFMVTDKTKRVANAFAHAEGFFASGDTLPKRANNPGDLKRGDIGYGTIAGKTVYKTVEDGWAALYHQVGLMVTGLSKFYKPSMTIKEIAIEYTGADAADTWAEAVAEHLGVTPETTLESV